MEAERDTVVVSCRITPEEMQRIDDYCKAHGQMARSAVVRMALERFFKDVDKDADVDG